MPKNLIRKRKRCYKQTNRFDQAKKKKTVEENPASGKKIDPALPESGHKNGFNFIVNFSTLSDVFKSLLCPVCDVSALELHKKSKYGLCYVLELRYSKCE